MQAWGVGRATGYLIGACFPCITSLTLHSVNLKDGTLFSGLLRSRVPVSCLKLISCFTNEAIDPASAAALQALPVTELYIQGGAGVLAALASGLTQLTRAALTASDLTTTQIMQYAGNMTQLQHLTAGGLGPCEPSALQQAMHACSQLTSLTLTCSLNQQGLDVLLSHAGHLASVSFQYQHQQHPACGRS
jgi:hypothetical protein